MSARVKLAAGLLGLALLLGGCSGLGSDDEVPEQVKGPSLLSKADVQAQPAGSPQRTMFEWWRALQFDDAPAAARYYASDVRLTTDKLDKILSLGAPTLGLTRRPRVVETDTNGDAATVRVLLEDDEPQANGRIDRNQTARAFDLVREAGAWKMADNRYLARPADRVAEFAAEARRRVQEGNEP